MTKHAEQYLAHAENRITICRVNALLWAAKGNDLDSETAKAAMYKWIGLAQENHQEDHF